MLTEGTMALLNDPYSGGSHLPDLTLVAPVFVSGHHIGFVANRAHHADVGGISPGSMPGLSLHIEEEGVVISPRIIVRNGRLDKNEVNDLLEATRTPQEREGDLAAQIAANNVGTRRMEAVVSRHKLDVVVRSFDELRFYSSSMMLSALRQHSGAESSFTDYIESDGAGNWDIPISVKISIKDDGTDISFKGTSPQVDGNVNCPIASTLSSVYYVFIAIFGKGIPTNQGCWSVLNVDVPEESLLNPQYPAPVSAGNVETSQRIVDTVLGALSSIVPELVPAASQGTMNNLTIGGFDPRYQKEFSFYETIGGGSGAIRGHHGTSGIHTHMTNTLNTPIESLETEYPLRVLRYSLRNGSGGKGQWNGGEGLIREIELLADDCVISIQSERRTRNPWGLENGNDGTSGRNVIIVDKKEHALQSKTTVKTLEGTVVRIETPGGGGWGSQDEN
jgi:N-methylhydantoinase B